MAVFITVPVLILVQAPNGSANADGDFDGESSAMTSCANKPSAFPTSIFTKIKTDSNGTFSGLEIHVSNSSRICSTVLYSFNTANK